jgi:MFS family permease
VPDVPGTACRVILAHALAALGMSLPWPLLVVLAHDRVAGTAHGDLLLGLTGAARMLPYVVLSWATGMLADRFPRDIILRLTIWAGLCCWSRWPRRWPTDCLPQRSWERLDDAPPTCW